MNKIYRTVYNETTGTWVAVCETAKTHTKSSGKSSVVKAVAAAGLMAVAGVAGAASVIGTSTDPVAMATENGATKLKVEAVEAALGRTLTKNADGSYSDATDVVIDTNGLLTSYGQTIVPHIVNRNGKALSQLAVGDNAHSNDGGAIAVGSNSYAGGARSVSVGMGASSNGHGAVAIGGGLSGSTLEGAVANGQGAVAIGTSVTAKGEGTVAIGGTSSAYHSDTLGKGTVAIGRNARAKVSILERDATTHKINESQLISTTGKSILTENGATDRYLAFDRGGAQLHSNLNLGQNIAIGDESQAYSHQSIAVGANTMALGVGAIAIGGDDLGQKSDLNKTDSDSGYDAGFTASMKTLDKVDTALGNIRTDYNDKASLQVTNKPRVITNTLEDNNKAYVDTTMAVGDGSMAIGFKSAAKGSLSDAIGMGAMATGDSSLAVGTAAEAQGEFSNAIGAAAFATANNANAFGLSAIAEGEYSNAIGTSAASGEKSSAMGYMNRAIGANAVAVGTQNLSGGTNTQDTVAMGVDNEATGDKSVAIGASFEETTTTGTVTRKNQATGSNSIVIGSGNTASQTESVAIGKGNTASGYQSLAYGSVSTTSGDQSISFGSGNEVQSINAGVFGTGSKILDTSATKNANASYSVGNKNTITSDNTFVLGNRIGEVAGQPNATLRNSVYLGSDSTTISTASRGSTATYDTATVGGITYGATLNGETGNAQDKGFAGHTPVGVVSVGKAAVAGKVSNVEARRIQNVAAGEISETSTDAINGSQLFAVLPQYTDADGNQYPESVTVGNQTYKFANYKAGDNINIAADGTISATISSGSNNITSDNRVVTLSSNKITSPYLVINNLTGSSIYANAVGDGNRAVAMGHGAEAHQQDSIAIGTGAQNGYDNYGANTASQGDKADGEGSIAIGFHAVNYNINGDPGKDPTGADDRYINASKSVAIGYNAHTHAANAVAVGAGADATGERAISIGGTAGETVQNVGGGYQTTHRHEASRAAGQGSIAIGDQARTVNTKNSSDHTSSEVMQRDTDANDAVAIGTQALAQKQSAIALGGGVSYTDTSGTSNTTTYSKTGAKAGGVASVAIGGASEHTTAAVVTGDYSAAVGTGSSVATEKTFVLGSNVSTTQDNSVFLGDSAAFVDEGTSSKGAAAYESETINNMTFNYAGGADTTVVGVVSVGNDSETRRIQNVAPGLVSADSTDAINGSQLYAVLPQYTNKNGDPAADSDTVSSVTIGGNTYNFADDTNTVTDITVNASEDAAGNTTGNLLLAKDDSNAANPIYNIQLNDTVDLSDSGSLNVGGENTDSPTTLVEAGNVTVDDGKGNSVEIAGDNINFTNSDGGSVSGLSQHFIFTADNTAPTEVSGTTDDQAATVGDVRNVGWQLQVGGENKDFINHGDVLDFQAGDGATVAFENGVITYAVDKNPTDPTINTTVTEGDSGTVTGGVDNKYWDSNQVQQAINDAGWKIGTGAAANSNDALINAGGRVGLIAGNGVKIEQDVGTGNFTFSGVSIVDDNNDTTVDALEDADGNRYTISGSGGDKNWNLTVNGANSTSPNAKRNLKNSSNIVINQTPDTTDPTKADISFDLANVVTVGNDLVSGSPVTINGNDGKIEFTNNAGSITNVASHLADQVATDKVIKDENKPDTPAITNAKNEAATVGDVLNAGWNLQVADDKGTLQAADFVQHGDTVKFGDSDTVNAQYDTKDGVISFAVKTADKDPTVTGITSTVGGKDGDILTAKQITQTINQVAKNWKWNIQGQDDGVNQNGGKAAEVKYDNTVNINAGKGLSLNQNGQTLTLSSDYVFKNGDTDVTDTGGDVTKIETTDGAGKTVTYNITGGGSGESNWNLTVGGDDTTVTQPSDKRNLTNTDGNIAIALDPTNNEDISFDLADKITVGDTVSGSPVEIDGTANGGTITFTNADGSTSNQGVIDGVKTHFDTVSNSTTMPANNAPANFAKQTNQAATLGDVLNAGWGLKANGSAVDFVAHGDTVNFTSNDQSITITPNTDNKDSVLDLSANVTFYADEAATQEAQATDKAKSVKVGNKTYQLGGDTYNVTGSGTPVTVKGTGSVKVEPDSVGADTYTVSIPVVANSDGNAATAASVANNSTGSVAMGENAKIGNSVADSIAIGKDASVGNFGTGNVVIGAGSSTPNRAENMVVIGTGLNITQGTPNAVVIGSGSAASSAADSDLNPNKFTFRSTSLNQANEGGVNDGANATVATFNVGAEQGQLRQIKGVAAGRTEKGSTDAVNGDQLYTVALAVDNMGYSLAGGGTVDAQGNITGGTGVLGESFTVNTNDAYGEIGTIIGKNIAGTGEDTIEDAIKATKTIVEKESGSPITVTSTVNADKSTTYTVGIEKTTPETVITDPTDSNVGKVVITAGDENKIVTAGDLATAINSSGWVASDSSNNAFVATGDTVTIQGKNGVKVELDAAKQTFTVESDYVFKDKDDNDITSTGGAVTTIETTDDAGNTVTYNIGGVDGNDVTSLTAQGESANSTTGNLKLTDKGTGDSHQYDIALNNNVELGDDKGNSGSLNVNNGKGGSTNIEGNKITFGDTTTPNSGSIDGLAQHFTKTGDKTAPSETADTTSGKADNQAATVGDVKNVGWNLKVGDTVQDFVNHGDTVAFADGTGTKAKYDNATGAISFDIAKAGDSKVDTTVTNADAGKVTGGTGDQYWDSKQVQDAINNAGWKAGVGATANAKDELINAGDRVGLVAGQGVTVTQDGSNFTFATDYVFKDGQGDDITNKGGDVATITTKDDKGNDVTYNFGDGNDNTVTAVTVNGGQDAKANQADGGNLKLTESKDANGNPTYDIALNDEVDLTDSGSLKVGGDDIANGSPVTNITAGNIDFGDTQGSITNVASHLRDPASKDDKGQVINPDNAPANFNSVKNEAATVGDVLNAGWNLKVGDTDADFVQHGDTVAFGNSDTVNAAYDGGVIKFNANTTPLTVNNTTGVVNAPANNNALVTAGDVQTAINNAGWFVSSQGRAGAANPVLVNAGNEVKFIAGDGMDIVQNGKELTFNAKIVDTNGNQLKLDQDGNYVVGIVDPSGNPVTVNSDGEFVVGGGSSSGGGRPFVITADDGTGNQSTTTIDGVAKTEGSGVTFVGDENVKVIKQPTQGGDGTDVVVGLQNVVNVGGTSDGTSGGQPNAGAVQIDGTKGGNSIAISTDGKGNLKVGDTNGAPTKIVNVAPGEDREDAVDVGQLVDTVGAANTTPATNSKGTQLNVVQTTTQPIDENGNPVGNPQEYTLKTYNVKDQGEYLTNNVVEAVSKMNEQGIKFFHTNEDENFVPTAQDHNQVDSSASGGLSTAIGVQAKATGKQAIVVGNKSEANGVQSIAVGTQVVVNGDHSGGIGDPTIIDGSNSYSVGNHNIVATDNTFVLGNNVTKTAENSVFLGNFSGTDVAGAGATGTVDKAELKDKSGNVVATYGGFAGETANGLVSVGGTDDKGQVVVRRVSGVAAGEISATSTDAINGSQLHAVLPQYTVGSNGKVDNVTVGDKTYDFANYDFVGADGVDVNVNGATNTVTISGTPGYANGIKAGDNVTFNYEDNKKPVTGEQLYVPNGVVYETDAGTETTDPALAKKDVNGNPVQVTGTVNPTLAKVDAAGNPVKQQTTVINANLKPVHNRIDQVQNQVQQVENNAYAGVAQAMATAGLPQAYLPGKSMVAIAGGHYKGEQGYAVGVSSISDSGNWVFKATASGNSRGSVGGTIGAGYQW